VPLPVPSTRELSDSPLQHVLSRDLPTPARILVIPRSKQPIKLVLGRDREALTASPHIPSDRELLLSSQGQKAIRGAPPPSSPAKAELSQPLPHAMAPVVVQEACAEAPSSLIPSVLAQESSGYKYKRTSRP
jgi:hypothetical protein